MPTKLAWGIGGVGSLLVLLAITKHPWSGNFAARQYEDVPHAYGEDQPEEGADIEVTDIGPTARMAE